MKTIPASEANQSFASLIDMATQEPIVIQREKQDVAVLMSMAEYERLAHHNVVEFQRFCDEVGRRARARGLTEETLAHLLDD